MGLFDELSDQLSPASAEDFRILLGRSMEDLRIKSGAHDSCGNSARRRGRLISKRARLSSKHRMAWS